MLRAWEEYDFCLSLLLWADQENLRPRFWTLTPDYDAHYDELRADWELYARRLADKGYEWPWYVATIALMPHSSRLHIHAVTVGRKFVHRSVQRECGKPRRRGENRRRVMGHVDIRRIEREKFAFRANYIARNAWQYAEAHRPYADGTFRHVSRSQSPQEAP